MMELLLKNGADVNIANAQNQSPLHAVLQSSHGYTRFRPWGGYAVLTPLRCSCRAVTRSQASRCFAMWRVS